MDVDVSDGVVDLKHLARPRAFGGGGGRKGETGGVGVRRMPRNVTVPSISSDFLVKIVDTSG